MGVYDNMNYSYDSGIAPTLLESYLQRRALENVQPNLGYMDDAQLIEQRLDVQTAVTGIAAIHEHCLIAVHNEHGIACAVRVYDIEFQQQRIICKRRLFLCAQRDDRGSACN